MSRLFGLEKSRRHAQALWQLDCDYAHRLSQEEREWLSRFQHEFYLSAPWDPKKSIHSKEQLRERWREHKVNKRDAATQAEFCPGVADEAPESPWMAEEITVSSMDAWKANERAIHARSRSSPRHSRRIPRQLCFYFLPDAIRAWKRSRARRRWEIHQGRLARQTKLRRAHRGEAREAVERQGALF